MKGLAKYYAEHILPILPSVETQMVELLIQIMSKKYGRTIMVRMEEIVYNWLSFRVNNYDEDDKFLRENIFGTRSQSNPLRLNVALLDEKISGIGTFCFIIW